MTIAQRRRAIRWRNNWLPLSIAVAIAAVVAIAILRGAP